MSTKPDTYWYPSTLPPDIEALVDRYGEHFGPALPLKSPWSQRRRKARGRCYDAAGQWHREPGVSYAEGWTKDEGISWIPHAWLVTDDGAVIELARDEPSAEYVGLVVPSDHVARAQNLTGLYGPVLPIATRQLGWRPSQKA